MKKALDNSSKRENYEVFASLDMDVLSDKEFARNYYKAKAGLKADATTLDRQNNAYQDTLNNRFFNFYNGFAGDTSSVISASDMIRLCQLAYWNNGIVGNVIDVMQEFTISYLDFISKKKASLEAVEGWANALKMKGFLDQLALEYYRSGNVIIYRIEGNVNGRNLVNDGSILGSVRLPVRYTLINPALVTIATSGFSNVTYYSVVIPASEAKIMWKDFQDNTDELGGIPEEFRIALTEYGKNSMRGRPRDLIINLNPENVICLYRKKQPYEPFAVPFLTRALDDIDFKKELRNMDRALARVISRLLVHVKVGNDKLIASKESLAALTNLLANPSTSTYLVTDHTVSIAQYFPDVAAMLDPKKYDAINKDIYQALGISTAAFGEGAGSFSNNFLGIKVLVERIQDGRSKILEDFLIPEVKRVQKALNIKGEVIPEIRGVDLNDEKEWAKIYTRLYEMGVFTAHSTIDTIRNGRFPTYDEEVQRQQEELALKDEGLFQLNLNRGGDSPSAGRPTGTPSPTPSKTKDVKPVGAKIIDASQKEKAIDFFKNNIKEVTGIKRMNSQQLQLLESLAVDYLSKFDYSEDSIRTYLAQYTSNKGEKV